jgi:uncharacterized damage-inducible protein DinB
MTDPQLKQLSDLARYMDWADATVWKSVLATPPAGDDEALAGTLHHLHLVQHIFLQAWTGSGFRTRERAEFATLGELAAWGREAHQGIAGFLRGVPADRLSELFRVPWASHYEQQSGRLAGVHTLGESALQVLFHTQHHRGQVCARLRQLGGEPPMIDVIVWYWAGRPDGVWELSAPRPN